MHWLNLNVSFANLETFKFKQVLEKTFRKIVGVSKPLDEVELSEIDEEGFDEIGISVIGGYYSFPWGWDGYQCDRRIPQLPLGMVLLNSTLTTYIADKTRSFRSLPTSGHRTDKRVLGHNLKYLRQNQDRSTNLTVWWGPVLGAL